MSHYQSTFERKETKYLITYEQWNDFLEAIQPYMQLDEYGKHLITNVYYDTEKWYLIRQSMSKPIYKEKVRLRSYGIPSKTDPVYVEIKKKFKGVVYKRRTDMHLKNAERFLGHHEITAPVANKQMMHEFESILAVYPDLKPAMYISYERMAYTGKLDDSIRITFDQEILYRTTHLSLAEGSYGQPILPDGSLLMEIKICGAMPIWLARLLSEMQIYPAKFSKYANGYQDYLKNNQEGFVINE
ncbi:polyphosphate polymerase domain-containing protein [Desemzia sp. FAM 24101]|uniref:polyphosphate polymerase domain-containing protein n=1 Tax=unclassified Desemzia TaxID=2685243 RepID=UPI003886FD54